jgi:hypothetical protein
VRGAAAEGTATDPDGDPVTLSVDGVTQDEPVSGPGDPTSPDAVDSAPRSYDSFGR